MKKSLISLAVMGLMVGSAHAQSSAVIYGSADISYVKETGRSVTMSGGAERVPLLGTASDNTYLGIKGQEDLGGGLKATFQLEQRFNLASGKTPTYMSSVGDFEGAANVGLAGSFGQVRFGRVNELSTETYRRIDPFDQNGVAGMLQTPLRGNAFDGRLSYTARYDSPSINGLNFGATYTVKNNADALVGYPGTPNNGYAASATYTNGPAYLVANYNKAVNSSDAYNWNVGGAYEVGPLKLSLGYERTNYKSWQEKYKSWVVGAAYKCGQGTINASYNRMDAHSELSGDDLKVDKYAIGYTHDLSKRTSVYANYAHIKWEETGGNGGYIEKTNLFEVGLNHKF